MTTQAIRIEEIPLDDKRLKEFVNFPFRLHHKNRCWTPPLRADLLGNRLLGMTGLLTSKHSYHSTAEVTHFLAWRNGDPVGRVSAAINHRFNEYHNMKTGFFGFWDVEQDYSIAEKLLDRVCEWTRQRGMTVLRGPGEYSNATHERQGILIKGFQHRPTVELTHNPPYYAELLENYGFRKAKDYHAYILNIQEPSPPVLEAITRRIKGRYGITTRPLNFKHFADEVQLIADIYNQAWANNWGFLPITDAEVDSMVSALKMVVDPGLVRFAFVKGQPAAVLGAFPDPNYALRPRWKWYGDSDLVRVIRLLWMRRHIPNLRLIFFGVLPAFRTMGIDALLYEETHEYARKQGYKTCEPSLLLEDNFGILRPSEIMGGTCYKTWRIYDLPLT